MDWVQLAQICPLEPDHMTRPAPCTLPAAIIQVGHQELVSSNGRCNTTPVSEWPPKSACVRAHACVRDANIIQLYYLTAALLCHCCTTEGSGWLQNQEMLGNIKENISGFRLCRGFRLLGEWVRFCFSFKKGSIQNLYWKIWYCQAFPKQHLGPMRLW